MLSRSLLKNVGFGYSLLRNSVNLNNTKSTTSIYKLALRSYSTTNSGNSKTNDEEPKEKKFRVDRDYKEKVKEDEFKFKEQQNEKEGEESSPHGEKIVQPPRSATTTILLFTVATTVGSLFLYNFKKDASDDEIAKLGKISSNILNHMAIPFRERFDNTYNNLIREHPIFDAVFGPAPLQKLLGPPLPEGVGRQYTLVIDLDTIVSVSMSNKHPALYKRAALDYFLSNLAKYYEVVIYSNSMPTNNPELISFKIDPQGNYLSSQLFLDSGLKERGQFSHRVEMLNRDPKKVIFLDTHSYSHPNVINIGKFNPNTRESILINLLPVLKNIATTKVEDVTSEIKELADDPRDLNEASLAYAKTKIGTTKNKN